MCKAMCQLKLCKATGSIHLFKIMGMLKAKNIKLNKNYLWDTLEINWKEVTVTFNDNKIDLTKIVVIKLQDKIKVRRLMNRKPLLFHLMLKQGITWFTLATENTGSCVNTNQAQIYSQHFIPFPVSLYTAAQNVTSCTDYFMPTTSGNCRCKGENYIDAGDSHV